MKTTKIRTAVGVLGACLALAACGDDEDPGTAATTPVPPQATQTAEGGDKGGGKKNNGKKNGEATATPAAEETPAGEATTPPGQSQEVPEGLPSTTPEPGPPVRFNVNVTDDGVQPNVDEIPENKSLEVYLYNRTSEDIGFNLLANGNVVGSGGLLGGDKIFVQVRNLLPGKLVIEAGDQKTTVKVVPKA